MPPRSVASHRRRTWPGRRAGELCPHHALCEGNQAAEKDWRLRRNSSSLTSEDWAGGGGQDSASFPVCLLAQLPKKKIPSDGDGSGGGLPDHTHVLPRPCSFQKPGEVTSSK